MSRLAQSLTTLLLIAALTACGGDDDGAAGMAGTSAGTGGMAGEGGNAGDAGTGGTAGVGGGDEDSGVGGVGGDGGVGGVGGVGGDAGTGGDAGADAGAGTGGDAGADAGVDASMVVECDPGQQDNDMDGTCEPACANNSCDMGTCDDSSGTLACTCDEGWGGANDLTCEDCSVGYRERVVMIGQPRVCELDTPATTNMRMWVDAADDASFTYSAARIIEWRSLVNAGDLTDNGDAATRPTRSRGDDLGRRFVHFDGVDDRLDGLVDLRSETYSIFVVARASAAKAGEQFFLHGLGENTVTRNMRLLTFDNATTLRYRHVTPDVAGTDEANRTSVNTSNLSVIEAHRSGTTGNHLLSAGVDGQLTSVITTQTPFDERLTVFVGRQGGASLLGALEGDVGEIVVFVPSIPLGERAAIRDYLKAKWKL